MAFIYRLFPQLVEFDHPSLVITEINEPTGLGHSTLESFNKVPNKLYQSCNLLRQASINLGTIGQSVSLMNSSVGT